MIFNSIDNHKYSYLLVEIKGRSMEFEIENIIFWCGFWIDKFIPFMDLLIATIFHSIIINGIIDLIKNYVNNKIESEVNGV